MTHQDLVSNLWVNSGEVPGNGVDDDSDSLDLVEAVLSSRGHTVSAHSLALGVL